MHLILMTMGVRGIDVYRFDLNFLIICDNNFFFVSGKELDYASSFSGECSFFFNTI